MAPTEDEIKAVESRLAEEPSGVGRPITDREVWQTLGATKPYQAAVAEAERLLHKPLPEVTDDLFLEYSRTGSRDKWQNAESDRRRRLRPLVLAECVENKGRFLPSIEELIGVLCAERTWVLPAHDRELRDFRGERTSIDLWASAMAWELATADWLLGDKLSPATRQTLRQTVRQRVLDPFKTIFTDPVARKDNWWITAKHNWNTVCLAGVTGAAVQQIPSRRERAEFLAAAVEYSQYYLQGYAEDGYCSEGLSYWNYGFGHYVLLAETVRQATAGAIDLYDRPLVSEIARFARKAEILAGVWPAFADCPPHAKPEANLMYFINRRWGLGLSQYQELRGDGRLFEMDIRSAYPAEDLQALVRTFVYSRSGPGSLTVTDKVELGSPQSFGTALITGGTCKQMADGSLLIQKDKDALKVTIDTGGELFQVNVEPIQEDAASKPTRIGIDLSKPVTSAKITVKIEPASAE